jgi:protein SCO1/2
MRRLAGLLVLLLVTGRAASADDLGPVADFRLTERSGRTVSRADLEGKVWVAAFFFTRCKGHCLQLSATMAGLHKDFANQPDVRLVSFSVDPEADTPEVLREYADRFGADPKRWLFLTGKEDEIHGLIRESFHLSVEQNQGAARTPGNEVLHSPRLVVVDRRGHIRGYFDGRKVDDEGQPVNEVVKLKQTVSGLLWENSLMGPGGLKVWLPAINAVLNSTCAALIVLGYVLVRARRVTAHKVCMIAALLVSAVFLASYLYLHFVVLEGKATRFAERAPDAPSSVAGVYYGVLLSHTVLAVIVTPMALISAYLGLRDRIAGHVRLARWTLPLWLYVSVTGVVVYWMLYRLYP